MSLFPRRGESVPAGFVLPGAGAALLGVGALAAGSNGAVGPRTVLCLSALVVLFGAAVAEPRAIGPLVALGWFGVAGFSRAPYGQLRPASADSARGAVVLAASAAVGAAVGALRREPRRERFTLRGVDGASVTSGGDPAAGSRGVVADSAAAANPSVPDLLRAVTRRRQLAGVVLGAAALPLLTLALVPARPHLSVTDVLLAYLLVVIGVTVTGGIWPSVLTAVAACLLVNWFFTPPLHTLAVSRPQDVAALGLFVVMAAAVSVVVHLAARRSLEAARSREESHTLLQLARTVLGGADSPVDVLDHLVANLPGVAELYERVEGRWVLVARDSTRAARPDVLPRTIRIRADLELRWCPTDRADPRGARLLPAFAAQTAAALDRDRLRAQAAQTEVLAAGNAMRTALLAAVSHDLRTPLASVKAGVSSLRQTDVAWTEADRDELLATVEASADRLVALIANLLDMSRLQAGAVEPLFRTAAVEEIVPVALRSVEGAGTVRLELPDGLPLVRTDPGLLERVLANLVANAIRFSPPGRPPTVEAAAVGDGVVVRVVDHGPGVPSASYEAMFAPFQRLGDRGRGTGVGLGLAVARGFAEVIGGGISAGPTPGGGLTMTVALAGAPPVRERPDGVPRPAVPAG